MFVNDQTVYLLQNSFVILVINGILLLFGGVFLKIDRRVIKTEKALEEALLSLLQAKPIEQITTTELCRTAGINRNTFYAHYPNPMNLLERIENEFIKYIVDLIGTSINEESYSVLLQRIFELIIEHKSLSMILLSRNGDPNCLRRIIETARVPVIDYMKTIGTNLPDEDLNTLFSFLSHGAKQLILQWTENNFDQSPEELAKTVGNLVDVIVEYYLPKTSIKDR